MSAHPPERVSLEALLVHRGWVRALARRLVSDPSRADDVEQETWRMALERPPRHAGSLRAWFASVARNAARAIGRSESRRARREAAQPARPGSPPPSDVVAEAELHQRLAAAVLALDEPYRSTVLRRWFEGKDPAQIAAEEGVPVATVRTRMKRGVATLRARMRVEIGDDDEAWCLLLIGSRRPPTNAGTGTAAAVVRSAGEAGMGWGVRAVVAASLVVVAGIVLVVAQRPGRPGGPVVAPGDHADGRPPLASARGTRGGAPSTADDAAQGTARAPAVATEGSLRGTIVRADGTPVAGARVGVVVFPWRRIARLNLRGFGEAFAEAATTSAADGTFSLAPRGAEPRRLRVAADGCAVRTAGPFTAGDPIRVVVAPGVTLRAEVRDEAGTPVAAARLLLMDQDEGQGDGLMREAATDASGTAAFDGLPGGTSVTLLPSAAVGAFREMRVELPAAGETTVQVVSPVGRTVRGCVIDAATRAPVAGASVGHKLVLLCGATTGGDGRFELAGWPPNWIGEIHVVATGYSRACVGANGDDPVEIALVRGFAVTGRMVDASGAPVPQTLVAVEATDRSSQPRRASCGFAVSGADGTFRVADLTRDLTHVLAAAAPQGAIARRIVGAPGPGGPGVLDLGDVTLVDPRAIAGVVTRPDGGPAASVHVRLRGPVDDTDPDLGGDESRPTDAAGRFRFLDLTAGRYVLSADPPGAAGVELAVVLPPDRDLADVRLPPDAGLAPIEVRVKDDTGRPVAGAFVSAMRRGNHQVVSAVSDSDGVVRFTPSRENPFRQIQVFSGELLVPIVEVTDDVRSYEIVVERAVRVTCRLVDAEGRPIEKGILRVAPSTARMPFTGADGRVTFAIPARGESTVRFDGEIAGGKAMLLEARAHHVNADAGEIVLRCRTVAAGRTMSVRVVAADGSAAPGVQVRLWNQAGFTRDATTDAAGVARFSDLPAREFGVLVLAGPGRYGPRGFHAVPAGQEVVAQFPAVHVLRGEAVWSAGGGASEAFVAAMRDGKMFAVAVADSSGRFTLEVPADDPRPFRLRVSAVQGATTAEETLEAVRAGGALRIVLRPR